MGDSTSCDGPGLSEERLLDWRLEGCGRQQPERPVQRRLAQGGMLGGGLTVSHTGLEALSTGYHDSNANSAKYVYCDFHWVAKAAKRWVSHVSSSLS